jgi:hypothetical protein
MAAEQEQKQGFPPASPAAAADWRQPAHLGLSGCRAVPSLTLPPPTSITTTSCMPAPPLGAPAPLGDCPTDCCLLCFAFGGQM